MYTRGEQTKAAIAAAAVALIAERGWGRASARAVAERAGVRPGLLHYYFASQDELLASAAVDQLRRAVGELGEMIAADPNAGLAALAQTFADHDWTNDPTYLVAIETYFAATRNPSVGVEVARLVSEFRDQLEAALRRIGTPNPHARAAVIAGAIDGLVMHRAVDPQVPIESALEELKTWTEAGGRK